MSRFGLGLTSAVLCLVVSGCGGLAAGAVTDPQAEQHGKPDIVIAEPAALSSLAPVVTPAPAAESESAPLQLDDILGEDGRLSVLVLGSDFRKGIIGERTDAIIVATIDPDSGRVVMASLPRDTVNVPIGPNKVYRDRINTLYWSFQRSSGKKKVALRKTRKALEFAFGTEIDYYALVDFNGLVKLIDSIGGVEVTLEEKLVDPTMHLSKKGLRLKVGTHEINGKTALAFSRTRHADSDYERSRRQQQVIAAAGRKVRDRDLSELPALIELVRDKTITDFPLRAAPLLLGLAADAKLNKPKSLVLAPRRFAKQGPSTYTISPRLIEVRKMFDRAFGPLP